MSWCISITQVEKSKKSWVGPLVNDNHENCLIVRAMIIPVVHMFVNLFVHPVKLVCKRLLRLKKPFGKVTKSFSAKTNSSRGSTQLSLDYQLNL